VVFVSVQNGSECNIQCIKESSSEESNKRMPMNAAKVKLTIYKKTEQTHSVSMICDMRTHTHTERGRENKLWFK
jgi:hypothetical protein